MRDRKALARILSRCSKTGYGFPGVTAPGKPDVLEIIPKAAQSVLCMLSVIVTQLGYADILPHFTISGNLSFQLRHVMYNPNAHLRFNFRQACQAVAFLLRRRPGSRMNYMRLLKLLYVAERECLRDGGFAIAGGPVVAMPRGPVLQEIYGLIRGIHYHSPEWMKFFHTESYHLVMHSDPGIGALTPFIAKKLEAVAQRHEEDDEWSMVEFTHELPEWKKNDPGTSSKAIPLADILEALGIADEAASIISHNNRIDCKV